MRGHYLGSVGGITLQKHRPSAARPAGPISQPGSAQFLPLAFDDQRPNQPRNVALAILGTSASPADLAGTRIGQAGRTGCRGVDVAEGGGAGAKEDGRRLDAPKKTGSVVPNSP